MKSLEERRYNQERVDHASRLALMHAVDLSRPSGLLPDIVVSAAETFRAFLLYVPEAKPTVEGLEALLREEPDDGAVVHSDGSVTRP